jgi:hypothetical protein
MNQVKIVLNVDSQKKILGDLDEYQKHVNKLTKELLRQEACLVARAAMKFGPPMPVGAPSKGDTAKAGKQGEMAVKRDISSIVRDKKNSLSASVNVANGSYAEFLEWQNAPIKGHLGNIMMRIHQDSNSERAFQAAKNLMSGSIDRPLLNSPGEIRNPHKLQLAQYRGRITRNRGPSQDIKRSPYYASGGDIKTYIKSRQKMVGKLKAGWYAIQKKIGKVSIRGLDVIAGQKGLPKYITRHTLSGLGAVTESGSGVNFKIRIDNKIGDAQGAATEARTMDKVLKYRSDQIKSRPPQKLIDRMCRNWNATQKANS